MQIEHELVPPMPVLHGTSGEQIDVRWPMYYNIAHKILVVDVASAAIISTNYLASSSFNSFKLSHLLWNFEEKCQNFIEKLSFGHKTMSSNCIFVFTFYGFKKKIYCFAHIMF